MQMKNEEDFHFWFPSWLVLEELWRERSKAVHAVYPVIASFCHWETGISWIGLEKISRYSGYSIPKVIEAVNEMEEHWSDIFSVKRQHRKTRSGRWVNEYHLTLPKKNNRGGNFPFHRMLIDELAWAKLTNSARSLYPAMRATSKFDLKLYNQLEDEDYHPSEFMEAFQDREYDICTERRPDLAWLAGISSDSVKSALASLEENDFIEPFKESNLTDDDDETYEWKYYSGWKVFLRLP
jgi:hypothetical protein